MPPRKSAGRPKKLSMPPLPEEIRNAMSEVELDQFDFFIQAQRDEHPDFTQTDLIYLNIVAMNYINVLRSKESEFRGQNLLSINKANPETQMLRWIDMLSISRKQRNPAKSAADTERDAWKSFFDGKDTGTQVQGVVCSTQHKS